MESISFQWLGGFCRGDTYHNQGHQATCSGNAGSKEVKLDIKSDGHTFYYNSHVNPKDHFAAQKSGFLFGDEAQYKVYSLVPSQQIQWGSFKTSCQVPIMAGDVYGSLQVTDVRYGCAAKNFPPEAEDDRVSTTKNSKVIIKVLENDDDIDGQLVTSTVALVSNPSHGSASSLSNGEISYQPQSNFVGTDSFKYIVCDNSNVC